MKEDTGGHEKTGRRSFREFAPTVFAVRHSTSVLVLLGIIVLMGFLAYRVTPKESFPEIAVPIIAVNTIYAGASPADVESQVTRIIEEDLSTLSEIDDLISTSVEGYSSIAAEFDPSVELEYAVQKVREKVDLAKPDLPTDAEEPSIVEFSFSEVPILQVNLSGNYDLVRLKEIAEDLEDRLETLPQVLRVDVRGGLEREVKVDVDLARLTYYELALKDVIDRIDEENVNFPGGSLPVGADDYLLRVDGEFDDPELIEDLVVAIVDGRPIYLRDIGSVDFGFSERESYARLEGSEVVTLDVIKRSGANIIETSELVKAQIEAMEPGFPPSTRAVITSDQSSDIAQMVSSLENNIVSALILIVGILLFFLGARTSIFVAISIPTSMFLSFIVLRLMGLTMNMVVLFSLILALGMLVDNAIVVVENIYRFLEEGWSRRKAAIKGTGEVAIPIIAATATTLAAFIPLLFWSGIIGDFMSYLPKTLIVTLTSSLFVALCIVPTLCSMFMTLDGDRRPGLRPAGRWTLIGAGALVVLAVASANPLAAGLLVATVVGVWGGYRLVLRRAAVFFRTRVLVRVLEIYELGLRWSLSHRLALLGLTLVGFVAAAGLWGMFSRGVELFPESMPPAQLLVDVSAPVGTRLEVTDSLSREVERELADLGVTDAESMVAVVGSSGGGADPLGGGGPTGPEGGRVTISLVDYQLRERDSFELLADLQTRIGRRIAGAEITVDKVEAGPAQGAPVSIEVVGDDPELLKALSDSVLNVLEASSAYPKLVGLKSDLDEARPQLSISVDRELAAIFGLNTTKIGQAIRSSVNGIEAAKFRAGNDEYDIVVRLDESYRQDLDGLRDLSLMTEGGEQIPLVEVASWAVEEGAGSIRRRDRSRLATITSDVAAGYANNAVLGEVQGVLADFEAGLPPGYTIRYTGQNEDQEEASAFLLTAFMIAFLLISFILISQFNSVVKPVIIMTSVFMSTTGVLIGLLVFNMPFGIINTGVGIISLAGIVVNNAIILIDYIDVLRNRDGIDRREALVQGGKTRFRPVVLTATTTALGLVPLAVGLNFDFFGLYGSLSPELYWGGEQAAWWGPMAVAIIAGVLFATFLTLVLVPVMYSLVDDMSAFFAKHFSTRGRQVAPVPVPAGGVMRSPSSAPEA